MAFDARQVKLTGEAVENQSNQRYRLPSIFVLFQAFCLRGIERDFFSGSEMLEFIGSLALRLIAFAFLCAAIIALIAFFSRAEVRVINSETSPNGKLLAENIIEENDEISGGTRWISIRYPTESPDGRQTFLLSSLSQQSPLFKWLDDTHLLISAAQESDLPQKPDHFRGVQITYSFYPNDPDRFRNLSTKTVVRPEAKFDYDFKATGIDNKPPANCELNLTIEPPSLFKRVFVRLDAGQNQGDFHAPGQKDIGAHLYGVILIAADADDSQPIHQITSASFASVINSEEAFADRVFHPTSTPAGGLGPNWQVAWYIGRNELTSILGLLNSGGFDVKLGFWLDNTELIYESAGPADPQALDSFEHCLAENGTLKSKL